MITIIFVPLKIFKDVHVYVINDNYLQPSIL